METANNVFYSATTFRNAAKLWDLHNYMIVLNGKTAVHEAMGPLCSGHSFTL